MWIVSAYLIDEIEKPCALGMGIKSGRSGQACVKWPHWLFNIMPDYSDRAGFTEQCRKVAVVL
jgi:hypothetical protein